jgi:hypothetical protein
MLPLPPSVAPLKVMQYMREIIRLEWGCGFEYQLLADFAYPLAKTLDKLCFVFFCVVSFCSAIEVVMSVL